MQYPEFTINRAKRAIGCSPFQIEMFKTMHSQSVSLQAIAGLSGVQKQYTRRPLAELTAENTLLWLIQVGVLRREVDGQGLTDSFRLTPLGRELVGHWQGQSPSPSLPDRLQNTLNRWLRLPA